MAISIKELFKINILKTIYINIKYFKIREGIRLPIYI